VTFRYVRVTGGPIGTVSNVFFESLYDQDRLITDATGANIGANTTGITFGLKSPQQAVKPELPRATTP
jgi:hypothetical protein